MSTLDSAPVRDVVSQIRQLSAEHDDAARARFRERRAAAGRRLPTAEAAEIYREAVLPVTPEIATLLYVLATALRPRLVVEFGLSQGLSTIHLAAALRDAGGTGRLITTEIDAPKAQRAEGHLEAAGVRDLVEIRVGDARETLRELPGPVDLLFLDGFGESRLEVLRVVEPALAPDALVVADESAGDPDWAQYHAHVNDGSRGYTSVGVPLAAGVELSVRGAPAIG